MAPACSRALPARSRLASLLNKDEKLKIELRQGFGQGRQPFQGLGVVPASACKGEPSCPRGRVPQVGPNRAAAGREGLRPATLVSCVLSQLSSFQLSRGKKHLFTKIHGKTHAPGMSVMVGYLGGPFQHDGGAWGSSGWKMST